MSSASGPTAAESAPGGPRHGELLPVARLAPVLLVSAVFLTFLPTLSNSFVGWDDDMNLTENPRYRGLSPAHLRWMFGTMHGGHYQPLSWMSLALDYLLWGLNPAGYHLTNLVLHAANAVLVYLCIVALLRRGGAASTHLHAAALAGALFFALHPLRVESVAWATARRDVLSAFFFLLAVLTYLRMTQARGHGAAWLALSVLCFVLSLLSKAWGVALPVVLLLLDFHPLDRLARAPARVLVEKIPYVAIALAVTAVTLRTLGDFDVRTLAQHGVAERTAQAVYGLSFYLWKTVVPVSLSPLYPLPPRLDPLEPRFVVSAFVVLVISITVLRGRRRFPSALAAWACYVSMLFPFLGFLQTGPQLVADRYTYLACLPWAVLLATALARAGSFAIVAAMTAPAIALVALLTFQQTRVWHDSTTLWEQALRVDAANWVAYTNRAVTRERHGDRRGALEDYTEALRVHPGYPLAWANRGTLRQELGDLDGAIADLTVATRLTPQDWRAWNNRGWARQTKGDVAGAIADYSQALHVAPPDLPGRPQIEQSLALVRALAAAAR